MLPNRSQAIFWLLITSGLVGCEPQANVQPLETPRQGSEQRRSVAADEIARVKIEVIGVYRDADVAFVREEIEALLPKDLSDSTWSASGNRFSYEASPVADVKALAKEIRFGRVVKSDGSAIRAYYQYDNDVPGRFHTEPTGFNKPPKDRLGPALQKHNGDWWAALSELKVTRQRNKQGEIIRLDLPALQTNNETMAHVAELTTLRKLGLSMCRHVTDEGARHLAGLVSLESLHLFGTSIGNPGQTHLRDLTKLKYLSLSGKGTEEGLRHLANLTRLESLSIGFGLGYPVTTAGLSHLRGMHGLTQLRLDGCEISDAGLRIIAGFQELKSLRLQKGTMTNAGLSHLAEFEQLRTLDLRECAKVGDEGLAHLASLTTLTSLDVSHTGVTDDGLQHLGTMTQLKTLYLDGTKITDAGMAHLGTLTNLRSINLSNTTVTELGLRNLSSAKHLDEIHIEDSGLTREALQRFRSRQGAQ